MVDKSQKENFKRKLSDAFSSQESKECDIEKAKEIFKELESLEESCELACDLLSDRPLQKVFAKVGEPAFKYLRYAIDEGKNTIRSSSITNVMKVLSEMDPSVALLMLEPLMRDHPEQEVRNQAAAAIADKDLNVLFSALQEQDKGLRAAAMSGLQSFVERHRINTWPKASGYDFEPLVPHLIQGLKDSDSRVRSNALHILNVLDKVSEQILLSALKDPNVNVRIEVVNGLYKLNIDNLSKAALLARALEDEELDVSNIALSNLGNYQFREKIDPEVIANALINTLVLRNDEIPVEHFNPDIITNALKTVTKYAPRLKSMILNNLCKLAYEGEAEVQTRSILVAKRLDMEDFITLVQSKAEQKPEVAAKVMRLIGRNIPIPMAKKSLEQYTKSLQELEEQSMDRWKTMAKQNRTSFCIRNILTIVYFVISITIIGWGFLQISLAENVWTKGIGGFVSAFVTIGGMLGKVWKLPMEDIRVATAHQANLEAAFIGFMTRVGQIRLVFEQKYVQGEIDLKDMREYQDMLANAQVQTTKQLTSSIGELSKNALGSPDLNKSDS